MIHTTFQIVWSEEQSRCFVCLAGLMFGTGFQAGSLKRRRKMVQVRFKIINVADPDTYVLGHPDPNPVSSRYGSSSGSFYHQEKNSKKNLDYSCFVICFIL